MVQKQTNMDILKVKEVTRELIFTGKKYKLLPSVQSQLDEIKEALFLNNTATSQALMDLFIADYGTHIITKVELGAFIEELKFSNSNSLYSNTSISYDQNLDAWAKMLLQLGGNLAGKNVIRIYRAIHFQQIILFRIGKILRVLSMLNVYFQVCVCVIVWREVMFVYLLVVLPGCPSKDN